MIQTGKINRLSIKEIQSEGIQLDGGELGDILLMDRYSSQKYNAGDEIDVFVYVDRQQRLLATTQKPYALVGEVARLRVVDATEAGAFLQWGLDDDLFVPKSEQQEDMKEGKSYVVFVFLSERSNRITGSSKIEKYLNKKPHKYEEGDEVNIIIYAKSELGYSAVVNNLHTGIIYENEIFQKIEIGRRQKGYIKKIREDSKIDLRLQQTGYSGVDDVCRTILKKINKSGGMVPVTDKSRPEDIYDVFGVSKKVFKKAIGALYKKQLIILGPDGIKLSAKKVHDEFS
ncbi:GntR family transcriptional regulator [Desulforhopalus vacuolatus]|uniref:CvfB family protein n=1 Tax=Desulforhopalus vacuolatus TaxID=40414 RepID=UPI001966919F|nr:S1-like domain-containing RNA-binding protein [Desulforhopalus vacuolatus]MBM9519014.1 GntR family transcriptional regulator [Desulforhopalus vacuolatus]